MKGFASWLCDRNESPAGRLAGILVLIGLSVGCREKTAYYSKDDFIKVPKIDAHFHYFTTDKRYLEFASSLNFKLLSVMVESGAPLDFQLAVSDSVHHADSDNLAFFGTFSVDSFGSPGFAEYAIRHIRKCMEQGASGIKVWKNIGMVLLDRDGKYVMIDDPAFEPIFKYLEDNRIPVLGHLGEPKDCWLPYDQMIDPSNEKYYRNNPQYYMYAHPGVPKYEQQVAARDHVLARHPRLEFIGAHMASVEWSLDELAALMDLFPNLKIDLAARMYYLHHHASIDREKVREFMIRYQDRILYATDIAVHDRMGVDFKSATENLYRGWLAQWEFLATDSAGESRGLQLPSEVIDKIYYKNAERYF